jgi:SRSO17 transposase
MVRRVKMELVGTWARELDGVMERVGHRFGRSDTRRRAKDYLTGLLSPAERKNSWQLAEAIGDETPYAIQQFLYRAEWEADAVRNDLQDYVVAHLGDEQAILVVDETGFIKKGTRSAGVKRQYSGTAGRIENCQIGVFVTYASRRGEAFVDRALYLPADWIADRDRCRRAGIPDTVEFSTKPDLAWQMLRRAVERDIPFAWVTGDCIYGDYRSIRTWLETQGKGYVLAVSAKEYVVIDGQPQRVGDLLAHLPTAGWTCLSAGEGAKGPRFYDWRLIPLTAPLVEGRSRWLLVRRSLAGPTELAAYACFAPTGTPLETLVQVAGRRWTIEACFETAKGVVGLDHYEVRSWTGWYRHITMACLAHALLSVVRAAANATPTELPKGGLSVPMTTSSLAAFKARRGLSSH